VSALYRVRQFVRAVGAWVRSPGGDGEFAARYLQPQALELFQAMPSYDQQHALNVCRTLEGQGQVERDLLAAALLHDAGKSVAQGARVRLWHRVAVVLIRVFWPSLADPRPRGRA
jgi:hypothetical protein